MYPCVCVGISTCRATEDFSYFTFPRKPSADGRRAATSLFGISCTRQLDAASLLRRSAEVTRSTVQKAVVVVSDGPQHFGALRQKLSVVTQAWFAQRDFEDVDILVVSVYFYFSGTGVWLVHWDEGG